MEQNTMKQKKGGRPKAKQPIKQAKRRSSARNNKKRKQKDTKMDLSSDDDSSETYCLVCVAAYSEADQMKSGFSALHVKSGPTKSELIFCIQSHLFAEIVIQTTQILIINS